MFLSPEPFNEFPATIYIWHRFFTFSTIYEDFLADLSWLRVIWYDVVLNTPLHHVLILLLIKFIITECLLNSHSGKLYYSLLFPLPAVFLQITDTDNSTNFVPSLTR